MTRKLLVSSLIFAAAGCGDNQARPADAPPFKPVDAAIGVDATVTVDAPSTVNVNGTISLVETTVLDPANTNVFGQGLSASIVFNESTFGVPTMDDNEGLPLGCKLFEYTPAQAAKAAVGIDQGPVTFAFTPTSEAKTLPPCVHTAAGYACPQTTTAVAGGMIAPGTGPLAGVGATLTTTATYSGLTIGRYVRITGATNPANNGVFPVLSNPSPTTIAYGNPIAVDEPTFAGNSVLLAAVGPTPSVPNPGFLLDADTLTVSHAASANVPAFTAGTSGTGGVANGFALTQENLDKLESVNISGAAFSITCQAGDCPSENGSIANLIQITTTDADLTGLSRFAMPLPTTKSVRIQCAYLHNGDNDQTATVPASFMAAIPASTTRIRTSFSRINVMDVTPGNPRLSVGSGHAIVGYSNILTLR